MFLDWKNQYIYFLIYLLFIFGCVGSSFLCEGFLQLRQAGATLHRDVRASHYRGLSRCRAKASDAQAQQLWLTGLVAPWHVGSSQTRARTRFPCIGRQILNHCATREARKNQYCENDYTTQSNLQIQCNPYQITSGIFYRTRTKNVKICMETQKTLNNQSNLEGKIQSWKNQTT